MACVTSQCDLWLLEALETMQLYSHGGLFPCEPVAPSALPGDSVETRAQAGGERALALESHSPSSGFSTAPGHLCHHEEALGLSWPQLTHP